MRPDRIRLELEGDVAVADFATAIRCLSELIQRLTDEEAGEAEIQWDVAELKAGSADIELVGRSPQIEVVERVVKGYAAVGDALEHRRPIPYSDAVMSAALEITSILNGRIPSLRFRTAFQDSKINERRDVELLGSIGDDNAHADSVGVLRGRVTAIWYAENERVTFKLVDSLYGAQVYCSVAPARRHLVDDNDIGGKTVAVTGWIRREPKSGKPKQVKDVFGIELLPDPIPGALERAQGVLDQYPGDEPISEISKRVRDGFF